MSRNAQPFESLTREREARAEAEAARDHLQRVFAQVPLTMTVFRGERHIIEAVTDAARNLYGREAIGCAAEEVLPAAMKQAALERLHAVYTTGVSMLSKELRSRIPREDGTGSEERIYEASWHALKLPSGAVYGVIAIAVDVTAEVRARTEAELQRARLARVLAQAPFAVTITSGADHIVSSVNDMQHKFRGFAGALGQPMRAAFPEPEMGSVHEMLDEAYSTARARVVREQVLDWDREGTGLEEHGFFDVMYQPIANENGEVEGVLRVTTDVSESVRAQLAVIRARDEAERARDEAETTRARLDSILAAIPTAIAVTCDDAHIYELVNAAYERLAGRPLQGLSVREVFPAAEHDGLLARLDQVKRTGAPARAPERRVVYGENAEEGFFSAFYAPLKSSDGRVVGVVASELEVTEQVRQRSRIEALRKEAEDARAELERAHAQLEQRIAERTLELERSNVALAGEIQVRVAAEAAHQNLQRSFAKAREDEQRRTARDLHDQVGQTLSALMLAIKTACEHGPLPAPVATRLSDALHLAEELGRDVHDIATRLRPAVLDEFGLYAALRQLVAGFGRVCDAQIDLQAESIQRQRLTPELETVLYRVVQEALTNVARHARARHVSVVVECHAGEAIAMVEDDGVGFDLERLPIEAGRLGLFGMRERVSLVGGVLDLESAAGRGATLIVRVPLARPPSQSPA